MTLRPSHRATVDSRLWDQPALSRRRFLAIAAPMAAVGAFAGIGAARPVMAQPARSEDAVSRSADVGAAMVDRAARFLASLSPDQRGSAQFTFDSRTRRAWNYMLGARTAPGAPLEQMAAAQKTAALDLLTSALSPEGFAKAERVMILQDVLGEMAGAPASRSRDRFSMAVFGMPSMTEPWGWRFEGHHLTLSFTLVGDQVVSVTPSSFSSNPNEVAAGRHRGLVALVDEEALGRRLYGDLSSSNRRRARIAERGFGNVLALAGREDRVAGARAGVPVADLSPIQRDLAMRLVDLYSVDHLAGPLAAEQQARVREGDVMGARFSWAGSEQPGATIYYRLHGDTFLIEFASLRNQPLHLHTIRHDFERNLGVHRIG